MHLWGPLTYDFPGHDFGIQWHQCALCIVSDVSEQAVQEDIGHSGSGFELSINVTTTTSKERRRFFVLAGRLL
jgi:hypothetical protein